MTISRRNLIGGLAAAAAVSPFDMRWAMAQRRELFVNEIAAPPLLEGKLADGKRRFELKVQAGAREFVEGYRTPTLGFNGDYLGPTIRCKAGEEVAFEVRNAMSEPTTVHWHGLHVPAVHDGGPHQVIAPGAVWSPHFTIRQKASMCWYHSHLMGRTGEQVLHGLAGLFLIDDAEAASFGLPSEYGVDDIPLVIQDRRFQADGRFDYGRSMHDTMMGYAGNVILVNGTAMPHLKLRRRLTRLRILNGSNARFYNLGRDDGRPLLVIGSDGGLLERPQSMPRVRVAPGERVEVIVEAENDRNLVLMSYPDETRSAGPMMMGGGGGQTFPILQLRAGRLEASPKPVPERLATLPRWQASQAARTRNFELQMGMGMMGGGPMMGRGRGMGRGMMGMGGMTINGRAMDMSRIDEKVPLGSVEIWRIRNSSPLAHPFHIHDVQFRVLDRDGAAPLPYETGLKDTVVVEPQSEVRVIAEFADYADAKHPYMYHCHILEHEDAGMMGQFVVV